MPGSEESKKRYNNGVEAMDTNKSNRSLNMVEKFKQDHEKIRKHMESLSIKYNIPNFSEELRNQYELLRKNARFSKMAEYLNLIDAWVNTFKSSSFSLDKLDKFQTDLSLLVLALKENLENTNEKVENWLELISNRDDISQTADRADDYVLTHSKEEQDQLFIKVLENHSIENPKAAA